MGTVPKPVPKYAFSVAIYKPGCWVPLARPHVSEEDGLGCSGSWAVSHLVEASHGLLINSGDVGHTRKG